MESGALTTVQWLLRALAHPTQVSLLVNAEQTATKIPSHRSAAPIVNGTHEVPDYRTRSGYGVVLLNDLSWRQTIERHGQLAAADVGCVAYAWGPEWRMPTHESSPAQTLGKDGQIPILSLVPVELLNGDVDGQPTQLVTGAACGGWGPGVERHASFHRWVTLGRSQTTMVLGMLNDPSILAGALVTTCLFQRTPDLADWEPTIQNRNIPALSRRFRPQKVMIRYRTIAQNVHWVLS